MRRVRHPRDRARDLGPGVLIVHEGVRAFYDRLADSYHLTYDDWRNDVRRQGAVLERRLRSMLGEGPFDIADRACGIGTQAIGLAVRGHRLTATDVSAASVERARAEADAFGVQIDFGVADMRAASPGQHDAVIACDNVFPSFSDDDEILDALTSARTALRPGGVFLASLADYDEALKTRARATAPRVFEDADGTRIVQTLTDWAPDGRTYGHTLLILRRRGQDWDLESHATSERAIRRDELGGLLIKAGFAQVKWHSTADSGFFQPIVTARPG